MKEIATDRLFIDYSILRYGVRVRQNSCRTIVLTQDGWEEYGDVIPLPLPPPVIDPSSTEDCGDLAVNVMEYETLADAYDHEDGRELRELLIGIIDLQIALGRSTKQPRPALDR